MFADSMEVAVLVVMLAAAVSAFPSGPAEGSCYNMYPIHGAEAQTSAAPYTITVNKATYSPGEQLEGEAARLALFFVDWWFK